MIYSEFWHHWHRYQHTEMKSMFFSSKRQNHSIINQILTKHRSIDLMVIFFYIINHSNGVQILFWNWQCRHCQSNGSIIFHPNNFHKFIHQPFCYLGHILQQSNRSIFSETNVYFVEKYRESKLLYRNITTRTVLCFVLGVIGGISLVSKPITLISFR